MPARSPSFDEPRSDGTYESVNSTSWNPLNAEVIVTGDPIMIKKCSSLIMVVSPGLDVTGSRDDDPYAIEPAYETNDEDSPNDPSHYIPVENRINEIGEERIQRPPIIVNLRQCSEDRERVRLLIEQASQNNERVTSWIWHQAYYHQDQACYHQRFHRFFADKIRESDSQSEGGGDPPPDLVRNDLQGSTEAPANISDLGVGFSVGRLVLI